MDVELFTDASPLYRVDICFNKREILYQLGKETGVVDPRNRPNLFQEVITALAGITGDRSAFEDYMDDEDFLAGQAVVHIIPGQGDLFRGLDNPHPNDPFGVWIKKNRS